jgi:hypothetical protein
MKRLLLVSLLLGMVALRPGQVQAAPAFDIMVNGACVNYFKYNNDAELFGCKAYWTMRITNGKARGNDSDAGCYSSCITQYYGNVVLRNKCQSSCGSQRVFDQ